MITFEKPEKFPYNRVLCKKCGTKVTLTVLSPNKCSHCDTELYAEMNYMPHKVFFRIQYYSEGEATQ